jgi:multiple sugar transport system ATP-binding protein
MADRIVVMNHGVIEQVGTPLELYRNPKNLFVAGFIGSPKMNFIEGSWAQAQGAHTVGIRPEHISISAEQSEWKGVVKMAESLGSDTFLHIQDSDVAETLTVRADGEKSFNRGQEVFLQPKKESLHLFNEKGERQ